MKDKYCIVWYKTMMEEVRDDVWENIRISEDMEEYFTDECDLFHRLRELQNDYDVEITGCYKLHPEVYNIYL